MGAEISEQKEPQIRPDRSKGAAAMTSGILVNIKEEVTCPICLELLIKPTSLDCGHTFCQGCIIANNRESMISQESRCPVCRISYQPENLRPNRHVANIVEALREVKLSPQEKRKKHLCVCHGERLLLFCKEDENIICWLCERSQEHCGHHTFLTEEIAQEYKEKLHAVLDRLREEQQKAEKLEDDLEEERTSKKDQIENEIKSVQDCFKQLRSILASEEQKELQRLEKEAAENLDDLAQAESELSQQRKLLRDLISDVEHRLQGSTVEMLQDVKDTMKRSETFTLKKPKTLSMKQRRVFQVPDLRGMLEAFNVHMTLEPPMAKSNIVISTDQRQVKSISMAHFPSHRMAWAQLLKQRRPQENIPQQNSESMMAKPQVVVAPVLMSKLSGNAPEFYPSWYFNYTKSYKDDCEDNPTLSEYVQDFLNHLTEQPGSFETEIDQFAKPLNAWVTTEDALQELVELIYQQATSIPNFSYMAARLCNYLSHHLTICPQNGNFRQLLLQRCRTEYEHRDQSAKGDEAIRKRFHVFVLFLGELYLKWVIKGTNRRVKRTHIPQASLRKLLNALFSNPVDDNLICAVKLLKMTGSVMEDFWKKNGKTDMEEVIQKIENVVLNVHCSRDVKQMLLNLVGLWSSNWGRVHVTSTYRKATPENDPNYFMNEPTFYTSDGFPFTAADPDYQDKYQEILELLEREDFFPDYEANRKDLSDTGDPFLNDNDDEMDPKIEEAYEKFCLELESKQKQ